MNKFEIISIPASKVQFSQELDGIIPKGWVERSPIGRVLFKEAASERSKIAESRTDWAEKVVSELNQLINLPAARYELAILIDGSSKIPGSVSVDLVRPEDEERFPLQEFLQQSMPGYNQADDYQVDNVIVALSDNNIQLPPDGRVPDGIKDGADMFVGVLMLDAWIGNSDRHDCNFDIVRQTNGQFYLSPIFDNGYSLGATEDNDLRSWIDPEQYNKYHNYSSFSDRGNDLTGLEAFKQAASLRRSAAKIWLEQLASIEPEQIQTIFDRLPGERITPEAKTFALNLLNYNRTQLLSFHEELTRSTQSLESLYLRYSQNTKTKGLAEAVEIAKNALSEGVSPEQVADMLTLLNAAYQDLVARSGAAQARKIVVRKAQVELALSREERASPKQLPKNKQSR